MKEPRDDRALAAMAKELTALYKETNKLDPARGKFDEAITAVVDHAIAYAFRIGYRTRVAEEVAEEAHKS